MIRKCNENDFDLIHETINNAAMAYEGHIPAEYWREPYMTKAELASELEDGVIFWGYETAADGLAGVMGAQSKLDVTLIRHAYVRSVKRNQGIGGQLLSFLCSQINTPVLIGTWAGAYWAIRFYEKHGFRLVEESQKTRLLSTYWKVPLRQMQNSVVLADSHWYTYHSGENGGRRNRG